MSLPSPNLDDRKFQDLVDDAKRQIGLRCPDWTDHNVSDPGVTLIELFASMVEQALFRLNQVPEKNFIRFLEMIGINLEMPEPARTDLLFRLTRPVEDRQGEEAYEIVLPARDTVAATVRTETEEAIEFSTDAELRMVRPKLTHVFAIPGTDDGLAQDDRVAGTRDLNREKGRLPDSESFKVFSEVPRQGDCLYLGFEADVSGNLIGIEATCLTAAATGLRESYPAQVWEVWNGASGEWDRLKCLDDSTFGFNRSGSVELLMPRNLVDREVGDRKAFWVRCRYTVSPDDLPPRGVDGRGPDPYQKSPEVTQVLARSLGGSTPASQCVTVYNEILGVSDGAPGQEFQMRYAPVLNFGPEDTLLVGPMGDTPDDVSQCVRWTRVEDFSESERTDAHFVCDNRTGLVQLGPAIPQPDGSVRQYGSVPDKGMTIRLSSFRIGGGSRGNVREDKIRVLKTNYPYVASVTNPQAASGGRDLESLDRAKLRALEVIKVRNRAVTAEDFEYLAQKGCAGVGRAKCVQPLTHPPASDSAPVPGTVRLLIVPSINSQIVVPSPADLAVPQRTVDEVYDYLNQRRLLTTALEVGEPDYVFISTEIKLVADPKVDPELLAKRVREALSRYVHPLYGGPNGDGWPFRRTLTLADLYAQVGEIRGVAFLLDAKILTSRLADKEQGVFTSEELASNAEGVRFLEHELPATRDHRIRIVPMASVGAGDELAEAEA
ncbi:MAG: putative baseplate assembly protein [Fimbriimonadaceae bacterium]|nr:MAG: putative baseplate assembly protein [Fimbriimonadaceae bacterium]